MSILRLGQAPHILICKDSASEGRFQTENTVLCSSLPNAVYLVRKPITTTHTEEVSHRHTH